MRKRDTETPDLFVPPGPPDHRTRPALEVVIELARRIVADDPEIAVSHLGAEVCRATAGIGRYALKY
jgi:hypothetical protein